MDLSPVPEDVDFAIMHRRGGDKASLVVQTLPYPVRLGDIPLSSQFDSGQTLTPTVRHHHHVAHHH